MNDVNTPTTITTNDMYDPEMRLDNTVFLPNTVNRQVNEDPVFYIPDFLSSEDSDAAIKRHSAAAQHAKRLIKPVGLFAEVRSLVDVLIALLGDEVDARALQAEIMLRVIEKKLRKAHIRIDKHDTRHTNLFLAYSDLKDKADGGTE